MQSGGISDGPTLSIFSKTKVNMFKYSTFVHEIREKRSFNSTIRYLRLLKKKNYLEDPTSSISVGIELEECEDNNDDDDKKEETCKRENESNVKENE
ncbi:unnamed protein product [Didymodactylos carnosus]|uniref:Uncharacterized protein n=1 Tax=Didymodactylos carnosus TaxID=1234261 RepID=A0A815S4V0_9BILA|nr:unnamed protein product [Didymodactylos carnosus]CAF1488029.1 unnamed protein product [Didymodactylos carnosus]CAF4277553.1 unnamed protein product [Didymodactylos carnosus]CAF4350924.1 unnamed protein product [Didymodactylos carnosus]